MINSNVPSVISQAAELTQNTNIKSISVRLPKEVVDELEKIAKEKNVKLAVLIRSTLAQYAIDTQLILIIQLNKVFIMTTKSIPMAIQSLIPLNDVNALEVVTSLRLPSVLRDDLRELAKVKNVKYSELIRSILAQYVADTKYSTK